MIAWLAACGGDRHEATWLDGFGFEWTHFNHRVSQLVAEADTDVGRLALVGGTSTTNVANEPTGACAEGCSELPFTDTSLAELRFSAISTRDASFARGAVALVTGAEGASAEIDAAFEREPRGELFAVLTGLRYDSAVPIAGAPGCYDPANGWLPRRIAVQLGEPSVDGTEVTVPVSTWFEAGNTLEDERACIDAVADRAQVELTVSVLVVATRAAIVRQDVAGGMTFPWNGSSLDPDPQVPTDEVALDPALGSGATAGWTAVDWRFFPTDPDTRGAYLRSVDLALDPVAGTAHGQATNYSPITQLSGFEYTFDGAVTGARIDGDLVRGVVAVPGLGAHVYADGTPVVTEFPLTGAPHD